MGALQIARESWRLAYAGLRRHPSLFTVALVVLTVENVLLAYQQPVIQHGMTADMQAIMPGPKLLVLSLIGLLARVLVQTPCALAVHRYVLLGEGGDQRLFDDRARLVRFGLCLLALNLLLFLPSSIIAVLGRVAAGHAVALALFGLAELAFVFAGSIISVRLVLTLPGASIDQPEPWATSWQLSRGHWWKIFWTFVLTLVVLTLVSGVLALVLERAGVPSLFGVVNAIMEVVVIAVGAATASLLYRTYGGVMPVAGIWTRS